METSSATVEGTARKGVARRRRLARRLGILLCVGGVLGAAWVVTVWRWQDPFTALYASYQQHRLSERYDERAAGFPALDADGRHLAALRRELAAAARRYRRASAVGDPIARLAIPAIDLHRVVVEGTDTASLRRGPGRDPRTFMPGERQLVYIAGHRTTYGAPFARIDSLERGDRVTLQLPYARFEYRIVRHVVVPADDVARLRSRGRELLALQACHPRFFATHRYIAYARPVEVRVAGGRSFAWSDLVDARPKG